MAPRRYFSEETKEQMRISARRRILLEASKTPKPLNQEARERLRASGKLGALARWVTGAQSEEEKHRKNLEQNRKHRRKNSVQYRAWLDSRLPRQSFQTRRSKLKSQGVSGSHSFDQWEALLHMYDYRCLDCNRRAPEVKLSPDHLAPVSKGGSDFIDNIQPLCQSCNSKKRDKSGNYLPTINHTSTLEALQTIGEFI